MTKDPINPSHYRQYDVESIEMMRRVWGDKEVAAFCKLNAFKYRMRVGHKDDPSQDLKKESWYLDKHAELTSGLCDKCGNPVHGLCAVCVQY